MLALPSALLLKPVISSITLEYRSIHLFNCIRPAIRGSKIHLLSNNSSFIQPLITILGHQNYINSLERGFYLQLCLLMLMALSIELKKEVNIYLIFLISPADVLIDICGGLCEEDLIPFGLSSTSLYF